MEPVKTTSTGHNRRILIVDDDAVFCSVLKEGLLTCGFQCETALNGEAAVNLLKAGPFDAMITDVIMPGMDGFELARRAKECSPDVPVVVMTGIPRDDFYQLAKGFNAPFYIEKPFNLDQVALSLEAVIKSRRLSINGASE